ncbi:MAG: hypothetical protein ABFC80_03090 [Coriobacteriales bacterium]|nr:hypothetical protein [Actinomycetes bacterium]
MRAERVPTVAQRGRRVAAQVGWLFAGWATAVVWSGVFFGVSVLVTRMLTPFDRSDPAPLWYAYTALVAYAFVGPALLLRLSRGLPQLNRGFSQALVIGAMACLVGAMGQTVGVLGSGSIMRIAWRDLGGPLDLALEGVLLLAAVATSGWSNKCFHTDDALRSVDSDRKRSSARA